MSPWRIGGILLLLAAPAFSQDRGLTVGEDRDTVPEGSLRAALRASYREQPDGSDLWRAPHLLLDLGLSDWAELGLEGDLRSIDGGGDFSGTTFAPGDPVWRLKVVPLRSDDWAFGAVLAFKIPSASFAEGVGTDSGDAHVRLFGVRSWERWQAGVTLGLADLGNPASFAAVDGLFLWSAWARYACCENWYVAAEIHGSGGHRDADNIAEGWVGDDWMNARLGVSHDFGGWTASIGGEVGIAPDAPDWEVFAEVSHVWELFDGDDDGEEAGGAEAEEPEEGESLDRFLDPLATRSATTVDRGRYAVTIDASATGQADDSALYDLPRVGTAMALGPTADFRWSAAYRSLNDSDEFGDDSAFGDLFAEARWVPLRCDRLSGGLLLGGKIPLSSRSHGVSTGEVDIYARALASWWATEKFALHGNLGIAIDDNPRRRHRQIDALLWGLAAECRFHPDWVASLGLEGSHASQDVDNVAEGWAGGEQVSLRGALQTWFPGSSTTSLTLTGGVGLTEDAPEWDAALGVAFWLR